MKNEKFSKPYVDVLNVEPCWHKYVLQNIAPYYKTLTSDTIAGHVF
jgi:hypothetical protein